MTLAQCCREQRRLGYHAPATALGINMHVYWVGLVADLWRQGDRSIEWLLKEAMAGEVFNAGHAERGNDLPVLLSTSKAERVEGGFRFTGHKMFGSLAPGLDALRPARDVGGCRWRAEDRARLPAAQPRRLSHRGDLGHDGHARDAQRRCDAGGRVRARQVHRADRPGRRRRCVRAGHLRLGAARLRQCLLRRRAACDGPGAAGAEVQDLARG